MAQQHRFAITDIEQDVNPYEIEFFRVKWICSCGASGAACEDNIAGAKVYAKRDHKKHLGGDASGTNAAEVKLAGVFSRTVK